MYSLTANYIKDDLVIAKFHLYFIFSDVKSQPILYIKK
jgi:hypothetical protein